MSAPDAGAAGTTHAAAAPGGVKVGDMFGYPTNFSAHYDVGKELGRGTFGIAYEGTKKVRSASLSARARVRACVLAGRSDRCGKPD